MNSQEDYITPVFRPSFDDVGRKAVRGTVWMICAFGLTKMAGFASNVILARLLFPDDFGLFAIAIAVVGIVSAFGDVGTGAAVIYKQDADADYVNSAFWLAVGVGVLQCVAVISSAQWVSDVYGYPLLREMLVMLSVIFVIEAIRETPNALLSKELRFKAKALVELVPTSASAATSVGAALIGLGVWSLAFGTLAGSLLSSVVVWRLVSWRPRLGISFSHASAVIRYSKSLLGLGFLLFLTENIDYMIIGRVLGAGPLGLYSQAFRLATYPETAIVWPVQKVAFPTFAKLRNDLEALHAAFLKTIQYLALASFPVLTILLALSREFVLTVYGSKWEGMIVPLQLLCILGMSRSTTAVSKEMLMAIGRPDIMLKFNAVLLPAATLTVIVGAQFGIFAVAAGVMAVLSFGAWMLLFLTNRQIGLSTVATLRALQPALTVSAASLTGLVLARTFLSQIAVVSGLVGLMLYSFVACLLCLLSLFLFNRRVLFEVWMFTSLFRRRQDEALGKLAG